MNYFISIHRIVGETDKYTGTSMPTLEEAENYIRWFLTQASKNEGIAKDFAVEQIHLYTTQKYSTKAADYYVRVEVLFPEDFDQYDKRNLFAIFMQYVSMQICRNGWETVKEDLKQISPYSLLSAKLGLEEFWSSLKEYYRSKE